MYHLQAILHLMIGHQLYRWYKPRKEEEPKLITEGGTPTLTTVHEKTCPSKLTFYFLSFNKSDKTLSRLPKMLFCFSLKIILLCQNSSNAFEILQKTPFTSNPSSKDLYILWLINKTWLIQESSGLKPDWFEEIKLFSLRNLNISLNISHSNIFLQIGSNKTDLYFLKHCLSPFLWTRTTLPFSILTEKNHCQNFL